MMRFKHGLFTIAFAVAFCKVQGQNADMVNKPAARDENHPHTLALRIGAGLTPSLYGEAGFSFHKYRYHFLRSTSSAFYAAIEAKPTYYLDRGFLLLGPKAGYEVSASGLAAALETKYQSDGRNKDFVITPKIGFSLMGLANLMYGYNISTNQYPFPDIGSNQFSLIFNLYTKPLRRGALVD